MHEKIGRAANRDAKNNKIISYVILLLRWPLLYVML